MFFSDDNAFKHWWVDKSSFMTINVILQTKQSWIIETTNSVNMLNTQTFYNFHSLQSIQPFATKHYEKMCDNNQVRRKCTWSSVSPRNVNSGHSTSQAGAQDIKSIMTPPPMKWIQACMRLHAVHDLFSCKSRVAVNLMSNSVWCIKQLSWKV